MSASYTPRGKYFEQFAIGDEAQSVGRTITEGDIVTFAGLSGDHSQIHTDAEYARGTPYGQRIAHGLLGLSVAVGLLVQVGFIEGTIIAFRELTWKFSLPIFIGDTLNARATVTGLKPFPRLGGGLVTFAVEIRNQEDKIIQLGTWVALIAGKPG